VNQLNGSQRGRAMLYLITTPYPSRGIYPFGLNMKKILNSHDFYLRATHLVQIMYDLPPLTPAVLRLLQMFLLSPHPPYHKSTRLHIRKSLRLTSQHISTMIKCLVDSGYLQRDEDGILDFTSPILQIKKNYTLSATIVHKTTH
jgi:hypothetical protein